MWRRLVTVGFVVCAAPPALAEPYLALQRGLTCAACHVNRTGGGQRNDLGTTYGRRSLPWNRLDSPDALWDGRLGDRFRLGTDLRGEYFGSLRDDGPFLGEFDLSAANIYGSVDLLIDRLWLYADVDVSGSAQTREIFAALATPRASAYAKFGKFFLPFGLRLEDDEAFTRRVTGFNFDETDIGLELGAEPGRWSLALAVTNGASAAAEQDNGKQVTATAAYVRRRWRLGLSGSHNDLPGDTMRTLGGLYGGFGSDRVVTLVELDVIRNEQAGQPRVDQIVSHVELDFTPRRGLTVRVWYGEFDPDDDASDDEQTQSGAGVDWTVLPGVQLRAYFRFRDGPPEVAGVRDDEVVAQLHVYF